MDAGKAPGDDPLPFLIPLGPEDDAAASSGLYTPAPVRSSDKTTHDEETHPPVVPASRPRPVEPLVLLDPFGQPATQPPSPVPELGAAAGGFEAAFLGKSADDKPFEPPPAELAAKDTPAPFEAPRLDSPVRPVTKTAIPPMSMPPTDGAFQPPASGPSPGTFQFGGPSGPPPYSPPALAKSPTERLPLTAPPPPPAQPAPGAARPADRNPLLRQPHTAPPIRLPGSEPPHAKPIPGLPARAPSSESKPARAPISAARTPGSAAPLGFVGLLENAGLLAFSTQHVLDRLRAAPQPAAWLLIAHALVWVFASFAIRAGLGLGKASPLIGALVPQKLAAAAALGLGMAGVGLLIAAAVVHALGRLSGGAGEFGRSLIIVSLLAPLFALSAALAPVDALWWAPWALTTWLLGRCVVSLYGAPVWQVGIVVGTFALFGGVVQYVGHRAMINLRQAAEALAPLSAAAAAATATTPGLASSGPGGALTAEQAAVLEQLQSAGAIPSADAAAQPSGLSMLGQAASAVAGPQAPGPGGSFRAGGAGQASGGPMGQAQTAMPPFIMPMLPRIGAQPTPEQIRSIQHASQDAVRQARAALDDPKMTEGMSAAQKAQFQQARGSMDALLKAAQGGQKPSPAETRQLMQSLQQMMQDTLQPQQPAPAPGSGTPTRRRRRPKAPPADEE